MRKDLSDNLWLLLFKSNHESLCKAEYEEVVVLSEVVDDNLEQIYLDDKTNANLHIDLIESCFDR